MFLIRIIHINGVCVFWSAGRCVRLGNGNPKTENSTKRSKRNGCFQARLRVSSYLFNATRNGRDLFRQVEPIVDRRMQLTLITLRFRREPIATQIDTIRTVFWLK